MIRWNQIKSWLLPGVLISCILGVVTIPAASFYTYSGRSETPDHVLVYTPNQLTWDDAEGISEEGIAEMDLFDAQYANVKSADGENLIAPGTGKTNIVRLKNDTNETITYTAVLYYGANEAELPLHVTLNGRDSLEAENTVLPEGVGREQIIATAEGSLGGKQIEDFDVTWDWSFYKDAYTDALDTALGNREVPDSVTVGLYIQVEDQNEHIIHPDTPQTGDDALLGPYIALMIIGTAVLAVCLMSRRRKTNPNESN